MLKLAVKFYLLFVCFGCISIMTHAQCSIQDEARALLIVLQHHHYAPLINGEEHNQRVIRRYLQLADPNHVLYSDEDVQLLLPQSTNLLDTNGNALCALVPFAQSLHRSRVERFQKELNTFTDHPMDFEVGDTLHIVQGMEAPRLPVDDVARARHFKRLMRLLYLFEVAIRSEDDRDISKGEGTYQAIMKEHDATMRDKCKQAMICRIDPDGQVNEKDGNQIKQWIFEAIAAAHDPHTVYFNYEGVNDFMGDLQSDQVSYGIYIGENDWNEKVIVGLRPGSAAWRGNQVHLEDRILGVWLDTTPLPALDCMTTAELENAINNGSHQTIQLQLKAKSGEIITVELKPELLETEENALTSLVLKSDSIRVGYIALPAFYSSAVWWIDKGCANDVGKEILKLKKGGIQGLILDLRYNGGGDVSEAIDLAGLFIDVGPIGMQKERIGKPMIMKELSKGTLYAGPLVVLVNNFSASASELMAAAMQDYHRGVVVGSTTYGKATSQRIFPVITEEEYREKEPIPIGFVKATTAAIFRINTSTHQCSGVVPDVMLPNPLIELKYNEGHDAYPLQVEAIDKKLLYTAFPALPIDELQKRSQSRLQNSAYFKALDLQRSQWPQFEAAIVLHPLGFESSLTDMESYARVLESAQKQLVSSYEVNQTTTNLVLLQMDSQFTTLFEEQKNGALKDAELQECFNIVLDLIQINQN